MNAMQNFQHSIDPAGLRRLATVWLRDVKPGDYQTALTQLRRAGLGNYVADQSALAQLADDYFTRPAA